MSGEKSPDSLDSDASTSGQMQNKMEPNSTSTVAFSIDKLLKVVKETTGKKEHLFWSTQPVPDLDEEITVNEAIEADKDISEIRAEPYSLPEGFIWDTLNLNEPSVLKELYKLLNENYVEDGSNMFRFDYSPEFLKWALQSPGWRQEWHCGIRILKSGRLVAFISAIAAAIKIYDTTKRMAEINFLCVLKKLRSKRVAPVLIREITRRVNLTGIFQAVYTAGAVLPKPIGTCIYWHRLLNTKKLIEVQFSTLSRNMTMQRILKLYKLPNQIKTPGFRKMTEADVPHVHKLMEEYLKKFDVVPVFNLEEFRHWFLPRDDVIESFVVADNDQITDFVSFYSLASTVMNHPVHRQLKAAYSFYNVSTKTPLVDLMGDTLVAAKQLNFDVFNVLNVMENGEFLEQLKFRVGNANLYYYVYNWKCPSMPPNKIGLILH